MRFYLLTQITDLATNPVRWSTQGKRRWGLPGTECPSCEAGGTTMSLSYPSVELSALPEEREYRKARRVPWDEYVRLRDRVMPLMPPGAVVKPGTAMGPLVGQVRGRPPPVAMDGLWNLYAQPEGLERLLSAGVRGIKPEVTALKVGRDVPPLLEMELLVGGDYAAECRPEPIGGPCSVCGTQRWGLAPHSWWLDSNSLPDADVFRFHPRPGYIVGSERFVELLRALGDTGIQAAELAAPASREASL